MALSAGNRLGPYEILSPVGSGGQGEVFRAKDTRLDRVVAVKVLLPRRSEDPELRQRFEREARAVSALNHPHICTLHDSSNGTRFLVNAIAGQGAQAPITVVSNWTAALER